MKVKHEVLGERFSLEKDQFMNQMANVLLPKEIASPAEERHVQICAEGSDTLRRNARVIVVSYDLVAQNDTWMSFGSTEDLLLACRR